MADVRLRHTGDKEIPIPNKALAEWLKGPQCKRAVENITREIYMAYVALLPESEFDPKVPGSGERNLKRGAAPGIKLGEDRWEGWVINRALSYRPQKGQPYPRFIEYGKPSKGIPGGHELARAAQLVAQGRLDAAAAAVTGGMSGAGTGLGRARPARKREDPIVQKMKREVAQADAEVNLRYARADVYAQRRRNEKAAKLRKRQKWRDLYREGQLQRQREAAQAKREGRAAPPATPRYAVNPAPVYVPPRTPPRSSQSAGRSLPPGYTYDARGKGSRIRGPRGYFVSDPNKPK